MLPAKPANIGAYIAGFPIEVQYMLQEIRDTIKTTAPGAEEKISYFMPAFTLNKVNLVYFAAFKNHIGMYALPTAHEAFKKEFSVYKTGKGSVQFPLDKPMPLKLITKVVKFRVKMIREKADEMK